MNLICEMMQRPKNWFQRLLEPKESHYKLCPFEKSVMARFKNDPALHITMEQLIIGIRYAKQDDLRDSFQPVLDRLVSVGYLKKSKQGYYSLA